MHWSLCGEETRHHRWDAQLNGTFHLIGWSRRYKEAMAWKQERQEACHWLCKCGILLSLNIGRKQRQPPTFAFIHHHFIRFHSHHSGIRCQQTPIFLDIFFLSNKSNMVLLAWTTKNTQHCHSLPSSLFAPKKEEKTLDFSQEFQDCKNHTVPLL